MVTLRVNGQEYRLDIPRDMPLLWALRDIAGLTGTKFGCGVALCGACAVHLDGRAIRSCITPVAYVVGKGVKTIEAIGETPTGKRIQQAWLDLEVVQCGYCQSGQIMSAAALLASNSNPSDADIDVASPANICRCVPITHPGCDQADGADPDLRPREYDMAIQQPLNIVFRAGPIEALAAAKRRSIARLRLSEASAQSVGAGPRRLHANASIRTTATAG
jgi:isoquinoline 1-oxidoreductase alpha subunit